MRAKRDRGDNEDDDGNPFEKRLDTRLKEEASQRALTIDELPAEIVDHILMKLLEQSSVAQVMAYKGGMQRQVHNMLESRNSVWRMFWLRDFQDIVQLRGGDDRVPNWIMQSLSNQAQHMLAIPYYSFYMWCTYFRRRCMHVITLSYQTAADEFLEHQLVEPRQHHIPNVMLLEDVENFQPLTLVYSPVMCRLMNATLETESFADALPGVHPFCCWTPPYPGAQEVYVRVGEVMRSLFWLKREVGNLRYVEPTEEEKTAMGALGVEISEGKSVSLLQRDERIKRRNLVPLGGITSVFECAVNHHLITINELWDADELKDRAEVLLGGFDRVPRLATATFISWLRSYRVGGSHSVANRDQRMLDLRLHPLPTKLKGWGGEDILFVGATTCIGCQTTEAITIQCASCDHVYCSSECHARTWPQHCAECK